MKFYNAIEDINTIKEFIISYGRIGSWDCVTNTDIPLGTKSSDFEYVLQNTFNSYKPSLAEKYLRFDCFHDSYNEIIYFHSIFFNMDEHSYIKFDIRETR